MATHERANLEEKTETTEAKLVKNTYEIYEAEIAEDNKRFMNRMKRNNNENRGTE